MEVVALDTRKLGCRCLTLVRGDTQLLHKVWEAPMQCEEGTEEKEDEDNSQLTNSGAAP